LFNAEKQSINFSVPTATASSDITSPSVPPRKSDGPSTPSKKTLPKQTVSYENVSVEKRDISNENTSKKPTDIKLSETETQKKTASSQGLDSSTKGNPGELAGTGTIGGSTRRSLIQKDQTDAIVVSSVQENSYKRIESNTKEDVEPKNAGYLLTDEEFEREEKTRKVQKEDTNQFSDGQDAFVMTSLKSDFGSFVEVHHCCTSDNDVVHPAVPKNDRHECFHKKSDCTIVESDDNIALVNFLEAGTSETVTKKDGSEAVNDDFDSFPVFPKLSLTMTSPVKELKVDYLKADDDDYFPVLHQQTLRKKEIDSVAAKNNPYESLHKESGHTVVENDDKSPMVNVLETEMSETVTKNDSSDTILDDFDSFPVIKKPMLTKKNSGDIVLKADNLKTVDDDFDSFPVLQKHTQQTLAEKSKEQASEEKYSESFENLDFFQIVSNPTPTLVQSPADARTDEDSSQSTVYIDASDILIEKHAECPSHVSPADNTLESMDDFQPITPLHSRAPLKTSLKNSEHNDKLEMQDSHTINQKEDTFSLDLINPDNISPSRLSVTSAARENTGSPFRFMDDEPLSGDFSNCFAPKSNDQGDAAHILGDLDNSDQKAVLRKGLEKDTFSDDVQKFPSRVENEDPRKILRSGLMDAENFDNVVLSAKPMQDIDNDTKLDSAVAFDSLNETSLEKMTITADDLYYSERYEVCDEETQILAQWENEDLHKKISAARPDQAIKEQVVSGETYGFEDKDNYEEIHDKRSFEQTQIPHIKQNLTSVTATRHLEKNGDMTLPSTITGATKDVNTSSVKTTPDKTSPLVTNDKTSTLVTNDRTFPLVTNTDITTSNTTSPKGIALPGITSTMTTSPFVTFPVTTISALTDHAKFTPISISPYVTTAPGVTVSSVTRPDKLIAAEGTSDKTKNASASTIAAVTSTITTPSIITAVQTPDSSSPSKNIPYATADNASAPTTPFTITTRTIPMTGAVTTATVSSSTVPITPTSPLMTILSPRQYKSRDSITDVAAPDFVKFSPSRTSSVEPRVDNTSHMTSVIATSNSDKFRCTTADSEATKPDTATAVSSASAGSSASSILHRNKPFAATTTKAAPYTTKQSNMTSSDNHLINEATKASAGFDASTELYSETPSYTSNVTAALHFDKAPDLNSKNGTSGITRTPTRSISTITSSSPVKTPDIETVAMTPPISVSVDYVAVTPNISWLGSPNAIPLDTSNSTYLPGSRPAWHEPTTDTLMDISTPGSRPAGHGSTTNTSTDISTPVSRPAWHEPTTDTSMDISTPGSKTAWLGSSTDTSTDISTPGSRPAWHGSTTDTSTNISPAAMSPIRVSVDYVAVTSNISWLSPGPPDAIPLDSSTYSSGSTMQWHENTTATSTTQSSLISPRAQLSNSTYSSGSTPTTQIETSAARVSTLNAPKLAVGLQPYETPTSGGLSKEKICGAFLGSERIFLEPEETSADILSTHSMKDAPQPTSIKSSDVFPTGKKCLQRDMFPTGNTPQRTSVKLSDMFPTGQTSQPTNVKSSDMFPMGQTSQTTSVKLSDMFQTGKTLQPTSVKSSDMFPTGKTPQQTSVKSSDMFPTGKTTHPAIVKSSDVSSTTSAYSSRNTRQPNETSAGQSTASVSGDTPAQRDTAADKKDTPAQRDTAADKKFDAPDGTSQRRVEPLTVKTNLSAGKYFIRR